MFKVNKFVVIFFFVLIIKFDIFDFIFRLNICVKLIWDDCCFIFIRVDMKKLLKLKDDCFNSDCGVKRFCLNWFFNI